MTLINNIVTSIKSGVYSGTVVGVDIGSSSIKVIELQDRKGVVTLSTYGEVQLGPYAGKPVGQSVKLSPKQEQEALVDVLRESSVKSKKGVFAMPLSSSFVTNVSVEADAETDLASLVRVEARKVIPASLSEVTLDWAEVESINENPEGEPSNRREILLASIQNSALSRYNLLMKFAGLVKPPTEIECFSSIRGLYDSRESDVAIIDVGAVSSKLYIARKGLLMRMYRIRAGGALASEKISAAMNISFDEAEALKCSIKKDDPKYSEMKRAHDESYGRAFREFNQVIKEYERKSGLTISTVYLAGGGALFPGIDAQLRTVMDRDVTNSNPFSKVSYPAFMEDTMYKIGPSFTVALGAALRAFE